MKKLNLRVFTILFFMFLFIQIVPFLTRENMQQILILDYSFIFPLIFLYSALKRDNRNIFQYLYFVAISIASFILYFFGFSGSISGFILCSTVPYFIFNHFNTPNKLIIALFPAIKWASVAIIIFGTIMFIGIRDQLNNMLLMTTFFIKASINYVSLLFFGFTLLYIMLFDIKKQYVEEPTRFEFIIAIVMLTSSAFYSAMYLTRSTFIASIILFAVFFRQNRTIIFVSIIFAFIIFSDKVYEFLGNLLGLGVNTVSNLAVQDIRVQSINNLIDKSLDFDYNFTDNMSYSSLINVLFSLFPFSLVLGIPLIFYAVGVFQLKNLDRKIFYTLLLTSSIFICLYQMDFFSAFVLYFVGQTLLLEKRYSKYKIALNSKSFNLRLNEKNNK